MSPFWWRSGAFRAPIASLFPRRALIGPTGRCLRSSSARLLALIERRRDDCHASGRAPGGCNSGRRGRKLKKAAKSTCLRLQVVVAGGAKWQFIFLARLNCCCRRLSLCLPACLPACRSVLGLLGGSEKCPTSRPAAPCWAPNVQASKWRRSHSQANLRRPKCRLQWQPNVTQ